MSDDLVYTPPQHREYLEMMDRVSQKWLEVFEGDEDFYSAQYWDLFTRIWRADKPVTKTQALRFMTGVKSAHTAGKYLEAAMRKNLLVEEENPQDKRSMIIVLTPEMHARLDGFFDNAVDQLRLSNRALKGKGPCPDIG